MKTIISLFAGFFLLFISIDVSSEEITNKIPTAGNQTLTILCTPDLHDLTSKLATEYSLLNPGTKINIIEKAYNSKDLFTGEHLAFISGKSGEVIKKESNWKLVIGREVIAPIFNPGNPFFTRIQQQGVSPEFFTGIFQNQDLQNWGALLKGENAPLHIYLVNDAVILSGVSRFLKDNKLPLNGITLGSRDEVITAIQNDPYAIGFCKITDIMSTGNEELVENISLLPIDKNGNGSIDHMENIYSDPETLMRGVWIGKYPKTLAENIYAVSNQHPSDEAGQAFLSWVVTNGQQYMNSYGFCELVNSESQSQLEKINTASLILPASANSGSQAMLLIILLAAAIFLVVTITFILRVSLTKHEVIKTDHLQAETGFNENSVLVPNGLFFDKTHTWAFMEKDGSVTIGLDDFIQHLTGPITRIEMKDPGEKIKKGELLISVIQSGKQLNMYAPVSGTIQKKNESLLSKSSGINTAPYTEGWIYRIEPSNWLSEIQLMDMAEKYKKWLNTEFARARDFLAVTLKPDSLEYSHVVLQDGGLLKEGVLSDFGPEIWEDFQTTFLDVNR